MRISGLVAILVFSAALSADVSHCACDPAQPATLKARECSLCAEAEKQPTGIAVFFVKDVNPRKANRTLAIPRVHTPVGHSLSDLTAAQRTELWTAAIGKAQELWGDRWGVAYNGDKVRTQCHAHIHIGRLIPGVETSTFIVVAGPAEIPVPQGDGFWIHPQDGKLHVHTGEQITETVLLR
jgi:hypothetical protein